MTASINVHLLVDLENVQPAPSDVEAWLGGEGHAWVFYGPHQLKRKADFELNSPRSTLIPISRSGSNSLDFHLVFYLGYLAAKHPQGRFVVLAKDTGYDPPIAHARTLAFSIQRMKALPATATKKATTGGAATITATSKPPTPAPTKQGKPVAVPKKKAASSAKPAAQHAVDANGKSSPPPAVKKRSAEKPLIATYRDLLKDLNAANRPKSLSALKHHIQTKFGPAPVPHKVQGMIERLLTSDVIHLANNKLGYGPTKA
ncbi:PIN domain-containing protein [Variovorax sp. J22R115]|uniref:PIN domain-containing protein n=1 Tax=Variovorax sp. J22R115 TaxID=3053509 RepID=UPI002575B807|nr:PIN domain-containing protein [Variovorax sp. J22R115]MDM0053593.1 PIN domain-containing protein [Variovorax sp. J22R115]